MITSLCSVAALCVATLFLNSETAVEVVPELPAAVKVAVEDESGANATEGDVVD